MAFYNGTMALEAQRAILVDQLSTLEASLATLQGKAAVSNVLTAQVWRLCGSTLVFLMQVHTVAHYTVTCCPTCTESGLSSGTVTVNQ